MKILDIKHWRWILILALTIGLFITVPGRAKARPQQAIVLEYFEGIGMDGAILLKWKTGSEFETVGFVIDRADNENGPYTEQVGFIPAEGSGLEGHAYEVIDGVNVVNGQTYWYILVEIETDGTENLSDPISVTAGPPTPTPTYTSTPATQATTNSQATSTGTPSRTPTATSTNQSSQSSSPTPTSNSQSSQATATTTSSNSQTNNGNTGVAEASSSTNPYPEPQQTPSPTFIPDPSQANEPETEPYPAQETEGFAGEGYPDGANPTPETDLVTTPNVQPFDEENGIRAFSTQPPLNQQTPPEEESATPTSSNTLFLWIGFTAAFLIFVGGVVGSIFLFTRRSNQK